MWEVLNGVGVDGGRGDFPLFLRIFRFFTHFFAFLRFSLLLLKDKGKQQPNLLQKGEFHSDPICTDPVQNFPINSLQSSTTLPKNSPKNLFGPLK